MGKKKKIVIAAAVLLVLAVLIGVGTVYATNKAKSKSKTDLGNKYLTEAKYEEAIIAFEEAISIDKKNVDARIGASRAYVAIKKVDKAEKVLTDGLGYTPKEAKLYLELATVYLGENKIEDAIKILDEGVNKTNGDDLKKKLKEIGDSLAITIVSSPVQVSKTAEVKLIKKDSNTEVSAKWSTKGKDIGKIEDSGNKSAKFTATAAGKEVIIAKAGSIEKNSDIEVKSQVAATIEIEALSPKGTVGDNIDVKAIVKDQEGKEMDVEPTWSIEGDAKLAADKGKTNKVNYTKDGTIKITATHDNIKATVEVTVDKKKFVVLTRVVGEGSISISPNSEKYVDGSNVTVKAMAAKGWIFDHWEGSIGGKTPTATINVDKDKNVKAVFVHQSFKVTVTTIGEGNVQLSNVKDRYNYGDEIYLSAVPKDGNKFLEWNVKGYRCRDIGITVKVFEDLNIQCTFEALKPDNSIKIAGILRNGTNGQIIQDAILKIRSGLDNKSGLVIATTNSNSLGSYTLLVANNGDYTIEISKEGYIQNYVNVTVKDKVATIKDLVIMPKILGGAYRFNLVWDKKPCDLDLHVITPLDHIYYFNPLGNGDTVLDVDVTTGSGPENITIKKQITGGYKIFVLNYSGESAITQSNAQLTVYKGNDMVKVYKIPTSGTGRIWKVLTLEGDKITDVNAVTDDYDWN